MATKVNSFRVGVTYCIPFNTQSSKLHGIKLASRRLIKFACQRTMKESLFIFLKI
ncbi:hypothetical protein IGI92_001283 [Enterococcus sp. DIV2379]